MTEKSGLPGKPSLLETLVERLAKRVDDATVERAALHVLDWIGFACAGSAQPSPLVLSWRLPFIRKDRGPAVPLASRIRCHQPLQRSTMEAWEMSLKWTISPPLACMLPGNRSQVFQRHLPASFRHR